MDHIDTLRDACRLVLKSRLATVDAMVVLPDLLQSVWTLPEGDAGFGTCVEYCWFNPVKHGLVQRVSDWPFPSFHRDVRRAMVAADWEGGPVGTEHGGTEHGGREFGGGEFGEAA